MPEGDTLHRLANALRPALVGRAVEELVLARSEGPSRAFVGARVETVEARGKNLLVHFDNGYALHAHLGMTGAVRAFPAERPVYRTSAVAFVLRVEDASVVGFRVPKVRLLRSRTLAVDPYFRDLGADLLGSAFDDAAPMARLRALRAVPIGVAIMDQRVVSGIGNVYKSEVLFRQRLDPFADVAAIGDDALRALLADARTLLRFNVHGPDVEGGRTPVLPRTPLRTTRIGSLDGSRLLAVYRRKGLPCFSCGAAIEMRRQGTQQRSTYYCGTCQGVSP
jgi:endonuclease-8